MQQKHENRNEYLRKQLNTQKNMSKQIKQSDVDLLVDILEIKTEMGSEMVRAAMECLRLFDTKQLDYGSSNISSSGELGIAVRLQDKVSRMRHILIKEIQDRQPINHESLEDTYKDAANYALIGLLLQRKRWK